jgi:hypothetical protein
MNRIILIEAGDDPGTRPASQRAISVISLNDGEGSVSPLEGIISVPNITSALPKTGEGGVSEGIAAHYGSQVKDACTQQE